MTVLVRAPYEHLPFLLQLLFPFVPSLDPWAPLWHGKWPIACSCSCLFVYRDRVKPALFLICKWCFFPVENNYKCSSFAFSSIFHHLFLLPPPALVVLWRSQQFLFKMFQFLCFLELTRSLLLHAEQGGTADAFLLFLLFFVWVFLPSESSLLNVRLQGIKFTGEKLPCMFLRHSYLTGQHRISLFACHEKPVLELMIFVNLGSVFLQFLTPYYSFLVLCGQNWICCFQMPCWIALIYV